MKTLRDYINLIESALLTEWAPTPEQSKWLGGANQQDPYIMYRMPGAKPPVTWFTDPADQAKARQMGFPEKEAVAPAAPAPAAEPAPAPAAEPAPAQTGQGATPTPTPTPAPAAKPVADQKVMTLQNKLIGLGAKIKADGIMGPQTQAAMKQYGLDANGNPVKDPKTGQPVTNATTANAIIQRGGVDPKTITPDMTAAQQVRSDLEAQRANAHLKNAAPGSLSAKRNAVDAEYQAQNQAFLAKQAQDRAAAGQGGKPAGTNNVGPRPVNPVQAKDWARKYAATHDPITGNPLQESTGYNELDRIVSLVHYR